MQTQALASALLSLLLAACGGRVVVDGVGGTSSSSSANTASTSTSTTETGTSVTVTTGTGPSGCTDHTDCPGGVCVFTTGVCAPACDFCDSCGPGSICESCATSSCPGCEDCMGACVPTTPSHCDDDDPCPAGSVCIFETHRCAEACKPGGVCASGFDFCAECVTSSCCGCDNCVSACVGGE